MGHDFLFRHLAYGFGMPALVHLDEPWVEFLSFGVDEYLSSVGHSEPNPIGRLVNRSFVSLLGIRVGQDEFDFLR